MASRFVQSVIAATERWAYATGVESMSECGVAAACSGGAERLGQVRAGACPRLAKTSPTALAEPTPAAQRLRVAEIVRQAGCCSGSADLQSLLISVASSVRQGLSPASHWHPPLVCRWCSLSGSSCRLTPGFARASDGSAGVAPEQSSEGASIHEHH